MVTMLPTLMRLGQLYDGNTIGDSLSIFLDFKSPEQEINTILVSVSIPLAKLGSRPEGTYLSFLCFRFGLIQEAYLRGMMEFGGTVSRCPCWNQIILNYLCTDISSGFNTNQ